MAAAAVRALRAAPPFVRRGVGVGFVPGSLPAAGDASRADKLSAVSGGSQLIYEDAIQTLRRHVGEAFKAGMPQFPFYTLHGIEHLQELDRLALLVGKAIGLEDGQQALLRLAIVLHDYAMVDIPGEAREKELRQRLGLDPTVSLPALVRETHQDEFEHALTRASKPSREFPRLCRGGSRSLTYPEVPIVETVPVSRQAHERSRNHDGQV
jgi:hypothetical protein